MNTLAMFVPLAKADAAQRLVYGSFNETPDRAGETFDYASSKDLIKAWSEERFAASGGLSYGNVRGQHNANIAAGKLVEIVFDDLNKSVGFVAKIVDDNEWAKVEQGVYTGFSPGGKYAKRWQDGMAKRYTADVRELSIVDVPCNSTATFTMVKADGAETEIEFVMDKAYEPGNDATKARADDLAKAVGPDAKPKDYVVQARAQLIGENATAELAKVAAEVEAEPAAEPTPPLEKSAMDKVNEALAKGANAVSAISVPVVISTDGEISAEDMAKALEEIGKAFAKADPVAVQEPLAKGLRGISSLSGAIYKLVGVQANVARECAAEGDASTVPASIIEGIRTLTSALVAMAQEEVAELMADIDEAGMESDAYCYDGFEFAEKITDMVKADAPLMEKAGARNSKGDKTKIQSMHDNAVSLGAECADPMTKADLEAENDKLVKAFEGVLPKVEQMTEALEKAQTERTDLADKLAKSEAEVSRLQLLPAPPKGVQLVTKDVDNGTTAAPATDLNKSNDGLLSLQSMPPGRERANALLKRAGQISL
jgi:hypothetical protein